MLERLSISRDTIARTTPPHCQPFSFSLKRSIAPRRTRIGLVALIGPTIVMGRCFSPKYPNSQEASTIQDFAKVIRWACSMPAAPAGAQLSPVIDEMMNGEKIRVENTVLRNNTGITALSFKDAFLAVSYNPSSAADTNARASHILSSSRPQNYIKMTDFRNFKKCNRISGGNFSMA